MTGGLPHRSSRLAHGLPSRRPVGFTLIELLAVTVLMAIAASLAAVRLDGFTRHGRLRAALGRIAAVHRLARLEAVTTGQPRRITYAVGEGHCTIDRPGMAGSRWDWVAGGAQQFAGRIKIERVVLAGDSALPGTVDGIRIRSDGTSSTYIVVVSVADRRGAVIIDGRTGRGQAYFDLTAEMAQEPLSLLEQE